MIPQGNPNHTNFSSAPIPRDPAIAPGPKIKAENVQTEEIVKKSASRVFSNATESTGIEINSVLLETGEASVLEEGPAAETFPFMGWHNVYGVGGDFQGEPIGTYAVYFDSKEGRYFDSSESLSVCFVKSSNTMGGDRIGSVQLLPDPSNPGGYQIHRKVAEGQIEIESYSSVSDFIQKATEEGLLSKPLVPKKPYDYQDQREVYLKYLPYFEEMNHESALMAIADRDPGTFLIRDKENDPQGKVIVYKDASGDVQEMVLTPHPPPLKGFDYDGKWYPKLLDFVLSKKKDLNKHFKFSAEDVEARLKIAELKHSLAVDTAPPQWKSAVFDGYRIRLEAGEDINTLMHEAFQAGEFAVVKWLSGKGGSYKSLESAATTREQKDQLQWLNAYMAKPRPGPETLDHYALDVGYGYKSANLLVQERFVVELNQQLKTSQVEVPGFLPFSDFEMREHMRPIMPEVERLWNAFLDTFDSDQKALMLQDGFDPALMPVMIKPEGKVILEKIQTIIMKHFMEHPYDSPEMQDWLQSNPSDFLIIRSTGKEDTAENPNPGGNETIPYIRPDAFEVSKAIGQVVSSYFGLKSVSQRLMVGDKTLFTEKPFVPVLVMNMVTEKVNGETNPEEITRSGVMFTRQQGKAEGVTLLQVGLGNNEGVVASKVAVDTHYVDEGGHILSIVREKKTRYAPQQATEQEPVQIGPMYNRNPALEKAQALSDYVIRDMKIIADFFATAYGQEGKKASMDMEYTIRPQFGPGGKPMISLLQIRPLVEKEEAHPTYLDLTQLGHIPSESKAQARTLLGGDSSVQDIAGTSDVMFVENLTQGLTRYLKKSVETVKTAPPQNASIKQAGTLPKVIFTKKSSHLTSHEAIFFRNRGVVVFVVDDEIALQKIKNMISQANPEHPVKADPQRGMLVSTQGIENPRGMETGGYISYPIPSEISLPKGLFTPTKGGISPQEFKVRLDLLNQRYASLDQTLRGDEKYLTDKTVRELFDLVATSADAKEAELALATLLKRLNSDLIDAMRPTNSTSKELVVTLLQLFDAAIELADEQIAPAIALQPGHPGRLYALKFLDALVFQEAQPGVIDAQSWASCKSAIRTESQVRLMAEKFEMPIRSGSQPDWRLQMQKLSVVAFNEPARKEWIAFVDELADRQNQQMMQAATDMIVDIVKLNLGSMWLNLVFLPVWNEVAAGEGRLEQVLKKLVEMQKQDAPTLGWVREKMDQLEVQRGQIEEWSSPEYVQKNLLKMRNLYLQELGFFQKSGKPPLVNRYENCDRLGKLAILEFFRQAVDIYDQTIKAVTGSTDYPADNQQKVRDFSRLLIGYTRMLAGAFQLFSKDEEETIMRHGDLDSNPITFQNILDGLEHGIPAEWRYGASGLIKQMEAINNKSANPDALLISSEEFNVEPMTIGAHIDFNYGIPWPETLEEIFTTVHQNLERIRNLLTSKEGLTGKVLEGDAKQLHEQIVETFEMEISHISLSGSRMEVSYKIPLRQHSCSVSFVFDINHPEQGLTLKGESYGAEEHDRWVQTAAFGAILGNIGATTIPKGSLPKIDYKNPLGCAFTLHFPPNLDLQKQRDTVNTISRIMKDIGFHFHDFENVYQKIESMTRDFDWSKVNTAFFGQTPYLATTLMSKFAERHQPELLFNVCRGAFQSLISYGLNDYENQPVIPFNSLIGYYNDPQFSYVPDNNGMVQKSAKLCATLFLIRGLNENRELVEPLVKDLIGNPEMAQNFPETVKALTKALKDLD